MRTCPDVGGRRRTLPPRSAPLSAKVNDLWSFLRDGARLTSDSTLRFRRRDEMTASLAAAGYAVVDERQASGQPGREMVFIARRTE